MDRGLLQLSVLYKLPKQAKVSKILNDHSIVSVCELPCVELYKINTKKRPVDVEEAMRVCNLVFQKLTTLFSDSSEFNR